MQVRERSTATGATEVAAGLDDVAVGDVVVEAESEDTSAPCRTTLVFNVSLIY